jgi:hypothetical protein
MLCAAALLCARPCLAAAPASGEPRAVSGRAWTDAAVGIRGKQGGAAPAASGRTMPPAPRRSGRPAPELRFERAIHACLYRNDHWLLPGQREYPVGQTLASLSPTFVAGAMLVTAGTAPDARAIRNWSGLRRAVRRSSGKAAFDIALDLRQYARAEDLRAQMARTASALEAEAWTLLGLSAVGGRRSELLRAAAEEARRQGRRLGAFVRHAGESFAGLEYRMLPCERGGALPPAPAAPDEAPLIMVMGSAAGPPGSGFARGITPAERRITMLRASRAQKGRLFLAYPVFGPMAGSDRAYNALRDEFMLDAVRRALQERSAAAKSGISP